VDTLVAMALAHPVEVTDARQRKLARGGDQRDTITAGIHQCFHST
jgi:hypothetical protein